MKPTDIDIISISGNIIFFLFYAAILYYFVRMIYKIFTSFSFENLGSQFNSLIGRSGYVGFDINIRTDDALEDCKIKGKFSRNKLVNIQIDSEGENCQNLKNNNNI